MCGGAAKRKYCASRLVRGIDFTRTGTYLEYDRPASVDDCCHVCAEQQVRSQSPTVGQVIALPPCA